MAALYLKYVETGIPVFLHGLLCLVAYFVWSIVGILIAPIMFVFRIYKFIERALIRYQKLGTVFCTLDVPFLHETESNRNFIVGMLKLNGDRSVEQLRKWVTSRLFDKRRHLDETYKRLSQKVSKSYGSYVWTDEENFNIKQHIPIYRGSIPITKENITKAFEDFAVAKMPKSISPWIIKLIPTEEKDTFYLFIKIHHVIGDGFAMVGLLSQLVDEKPTFIKASQSTRKNNFMAHPIKRTLTGFITGPLALLALIFSINVKNPFRAIEPPMKKTVSWSSAISLELVKKIKAKTETTVNDVIMSCIAGAIRRYLSDVHKQPDDFPIAMTYNSRSTIDKQLDIIPLGNHSGGSFLSLPVSVADPIKRLHKTKERINKLKTLSHPHLFSFVYFNVVGGLPETVGRYSTYSVSRHASMIVSNVPGPTETLYIMGCPIETIVFTPPLHADMGLVASIFSYNKFLRLTVMSDKNIINNVSLLTEYFEQEIQLLGECTLVED